jgi:DNA (cytosine-5)-methyltransferase 1
MSATKAPRPKDAFASKVGKGNRRVDSRPELELRRALWARGLRYRVDLPLHVDDGRPIRPDVVFTQTKLAVFVDGCFWHACSEHGTNPRHNADYWSQKLGRNVRRDRRDDARLTKAGWRVLRIWEHENGAEAAWRVERALRTDGCRDLASDRAVELSQVSSETVSLFSGMGGLDLAAHVAGLRVGIAVDRDSDGLALLRQALGTPIGEMDLDEKSTDEILGEMPDPAGTQIVIGGPPCTAFSHAGFWLEGKRNGDDPAARLLDVYLDVVRALEPEAFVLENVPGLTFKTHRRFLDRLLNRSRRAGYSISWKVLDASDYGVAQARRRLFVVGMRGRHHFQFPTPLSVRRSSEWAIGDLADRTDLAESDEMPRGRWEDLLAEVPPGGNYLHFTERHDYEPAIFRNRGRYWSFLLKLDPDQPAPTVPAQRVTFNGPFHWANRHLRVREMARLQSMPDWMPLDERFAEARRHIGNAVPVALGATVLWALRRQLGSASDEQKPPMLERLEDSASSFQDVTAAIPIPEAAVNLEPSRETR